MTGLSARNRDQLQEAKLGVCKWRATSEESASLSQDTSSAGRSEHSSWRRAAVRLLFAELWAQQGRGQSRVAAPYLARGREMSLCLRGSTLSVDRTETDTVDRRWM